MICQLWDENKHKSHNMCKIYLKCVEDKLAVEINIGRRKQTNTQSCHKNQLKFQIFDCGNCCYLNKLENLLIAII